MKIKVYLLLVFVLFSTACSVNSDEKKSDESWKDEVLIAKECGMDGLMCCVEDPKCFYGQECCVDPSNEENTYCADSCSLGELDDYCRLEEPFCDQGMGCKEGKCVICGILGNPCCGGSLSCINQSKKDEDRSECVNGICLNCGFGGDKACNESPFCNENHFLNNTFCLNCGNENQPCCMDNESGKNSICSENKDLVCDLGFCSKK